MLCPGSRSGVQSASARSCRSRRVPRPGNSLWNGARQTRESHRPPHHTSSPARRLSQSNLSSTCCGFWDNSPAYKAGICRWVSTNLVCCLFFLDTQSLTFQLLGVPCAERVFPALAAAQRSSGGRSPTTGRGSSEQPADMTASDLFQKRPTALLIEQSSHSGVCYEAIKPLYGFFLYPRIRFPRVSSRIAGPDTSTLNLTHTYTPTPPESCG